MSNIPSKCIVETSSAEVVAREHLSTFRVKNVKGSLIRKIQLDKCAVINQLSCDYLFEFPIEARQWFIELKGADIPHAIEQLCASIKQYGTPKATDRRCYVVSTRCPLSTTEIQRAIHSMKSKHNYILSIKNRECVATV